VEWTTMQADVLVIGGGGAGSRAALEACAQGATTVLVDKQEYGVSGATAFRAAVIGQYQAVGRNKQPGDSFDRHAADILQDRRA
jgi:fumarate reductase (CoM/CoB) subunit A